MESVAVVLLSSFVVLRVTMMIVWSVVVLRSVLFEAW